MIRIGGASGYWGESAIATPQLLAAGVDVLVYDYLAEITMSLLVRARMKDPEKGYATDFLSTAMGPHLAEIARRQVKVVSNAGGINPAACGRKLRSMIAEAGLDLKVAVIEGDDLLPQRDEIAGLAPRELSTGAPFPAEASIVSMNAYLGAFPIAQALARGADIVITGRVVDSALALGPLIHAHGWGPDELDRLAAGSLVGHLVECGPQATGGNFTDWRAVERRAAIGYPIAEVDSDGSAIITKPEGSGGLVSRGTVSEQLVYELGDPGAYELPDVTCDFRQVTVEAIGTDRVRVSGARGLERPDTLKVCATHLAGWRGGIMVSFYGFEAAAKAREFNACVIDRCEAALEDGGLAPFSETSAEILGTGSQFGDDEEADEVVLKMAARHPDEAGITMLLKETAGMGLATPPGLCGFAGGRTKPTPVVQLFSFPADRNRVTITIDEGDGAVPFDEPPAPQAGAARAETPDIPPAEETGDLVDVLLVEAAWARSGDKGDTANIGVIARHPRLLPYLWEQLTEKAVGEHFAHVCQGPVERFAMPGAHAINFVLHRALGGGGIASLRNDPQGKGFSQVMLTINVRVPQRYLDEAGS